MVACSCCGPLRAGDSDEKFEYLSGIGVECHSNSSLFYNIIRKSLFPNSRQMLKAINNINMQVKGKMLNVRVH